MLARRRPIQLNIETDLEPKFFYEKLMRLDKTIEDVKATAKRLEKTIEQLRFMSISDVRGIFSRVNSKLQLEFTKEDDPDREVIRIIKPEEKAGQFFYKSTGTSRGDKSIEGVWFPFIKKDMGILREKRFVKLEDKYINAYNIFVSGVRFEDISDEDKSAMIDLIRNADLLSFGRFMDYTNASIAARLNLENF